MSWRATSHWIGTKRWRYVCNVGKKKRSLVDSVHVWVLVDNVSFFVYSLHSTSTILMILYSLQPPTMIISENLLFALKGKKGKYIAFYIRSAYFTFHSSGIFLYANLLSSIFHIPSVYPGTRDSAYSRLFGWLFSIVDLFSVCLPADF